MNPLENTQANFFVLCAQARAMGLHKSDICKVMGIKEDTYRRYNTSGYLLITEQDKQDDLDNQKWCIHYRAFRKLYDFVHNIVGQAVELTQ